MLVAAGAPFVLRRCGPISSEVRLAHRTKSCETNDSDNEPERSPGRSLCARHLIRDIMGAFSFGRVAGRPCVFTTLAKGIIFVAALLFDCSCLSAAAHPAEYNKRP
jgi:hypothetical protein